MCARTRGPRVIEADLLAVVLGQGQEAIDAVADGGGGEAFTVSVNGFESDAAPPAGHHVVPSMGIDGPHTFLIYSASRVTTPLPVQHLRDLSSQGTLWLELWYRERRGHPYRDGRHLEITVDAQTGRIHKGLVELDPTHGRWHKVATPLPLPNTIHGSVTIAVLCR